MSKTKSPSSDALLAKVKNRLKGLQENTKRASGTWKPKGEHVIRLVPYKFADYPFIELYFHYDLSKEHLLSPLSFNNPDPIAEYAEKIKAEGTRESYLLSLKLSPTMRTYVPVIIRGEESQGVRFWGIGKRTYEEILQIMDDPDYGNILDPHTGTDLKVTFLSAAEAGNKYGTISVQPKRNTSPLANSEELIEKFLNEQKNINEVYKEKTYDELKDALLKWLESDTKEDTATEPETGVEKVTEEEEKNVVKKADDAFNKFFDKEKK
jgi:hypothetical protein